MNTNNLCYSDLHLHTNLSNCAPRTTVVSSFLPHCKSEGIRIIGISNHGYPSPSGEYDEIYEENLRRTLEIKDEVASLGDTEGVTLLIGCEVETFYGKKPGLKKEDADNFDYVTLAASHIFNQMKAYEGVDLSTPDKVREIMLEQFRRACMIEYNVPTAICHPLYPICCPRQQEVVDGITHEQLTECFSLAAERKIAIEIHACLVREGTKRDEEGLSPSYLRLLSVAKECGCKFFFGSDAHSPDSFTGIHTPLRRAAERIGITEDDLWDVIRMR